MAFSLQLLQPFHASQCFPGWEQNPSSRVRAQTEERTHFKNPSTCGFHVSLLFCFAIGSGICREERESGLGRKIKNWLVISAKADILLLFRSLIKKNEAGF